MASRKASAICCEGSALLRQGDSLRAPVTSLLICRLSSDGRRSGEFPEGGCDFPLGTGRFACPCRTTRFRAPVISVISGDGVCRGRGWGEGVVTIALSRRSHAALRWHPCQFPLQNLLYSSSFALPLCFFFHLKGPSRVIYKVSHKDLEYLMSPVRNVRNIPSCEGKGFVPRLQSLGFLEVQCTLAGLGHHTCTLEGRYDLT